MLPEAERTDNHSFIGWTEADENARLEVTVNQGTTRNLVYEAQWMEGAIHGEVEFVQTDDSSGILGIMDLSQDLSQNQNEADTQRSTTMSDEYRPTSLAQAMKEIAADIATDLAEESANPDTTEDVTVTLKTQTLPNFTSNEIPPEALTPEEQAAKNEQTQIQDETDKLGIYDSTENVTQDFLSIDMEQTVTEKTGDTSGKTETTSITQSSRVIEIPLRYNLTGRYNPMVFRFHGAASVLRRLASRPKDYQTLDGCFYISGRGNDAVIYIYSNRFSTYSIATSDTETYTVLFETDGGSLIDSQTVRAYETAAKPNDPVKDGYDFAGWYLQNSDTEFDFNTAITEDTHLYARWTEKTPDTPVPSSSSSGGGRRTYTVSPASGSSGDVELSARNAYQGAVVTVTVKPKDGYTISGITVKTLSGTEVSVTRNADGTYSFTQPASSVTVTPVYAPIETPPPEPQTPTRYTTENPAPPSVTGVDQWLITETHPAFIGGFNDGTFRPNANISRAQAAVMFYRLLKNPGTTRTTSFTDMSGNEWYAEAVYTLSSMGIIQGYSDGSFHGNDTISRAAFAAIATRMSKANGETGAGVTFSDVPSTHWAHDTIARSSYFGWIGGYSDGTFRPSDPITRAAVTAIINRMLDRNADQTYMTEHNGEWKQFSDVQDPAAWYYYNVAEAANSHGFTVNDGQEIWNNVNP